MLVRWAPLRSELIGHVPCRDLISGLVFVQLYGPLDGQLDGQLALVAFDGLQTLRVGLAGMVETNLELVDLAIKSLLDAEGFTLGLPLGLKRSGH